MPIYNLQEGPHLHIQVATDPIPHAHIALHGGYLKDVLSTIDSLSRAISRVVLMLKNEVLDVMEY